MMDNQHTSDPTMKLPEMELVEPKLWFKQLTERELAAVRHARCYAGVYSDAGAPGHSHLMLIAKLCSILEGETE